MSASLLAHNLICLNKQIIEESVYYIVYSDNHQTIKYAHQKQNIASIMKC
jgi:hypothetical protein